LLEGPCITGFKIYSLRFLCNSHGFLLYHHAF